MVVKHQSGHISDHVLVVMASLTSLKPKYFSDAYDLFEGGRLLWQQKLCPRISQLKTSRLHGQDVLFAAHLSRSPQLRFSGEDLLLVVVSREFFGPFVRIPYFKKNSCQENRWKKNISRNHLPTIKKISERSLVSNKFETVYLNAKTGGSSPQKKNNKDAAGVPFTLTHHPKTVGQ